MKTEVEHIRQADLRKLFAAQMRSLLRTLPGTRISVGGGNSGEALQLTLASDDPERFYAGMGTMYLTRLAELASVATARFLPQP